LKFKVVNFCGLKFLRIKISVKVVGILSVPWKSEDVKKFRCVKNCRF
jgi:hypothetical protein